MNKLLWQLRQISRDIYLRVFGCFAKPSVGIHILNAHMSHITSPDIKYFEKVMAYLSRNAKLIRIEDAVDMIMSRQQVDKPFIAFTFDDGLEECYSTIAPVLEQYGINGAFFVNPNFIEGDESYITDFSRNIIKIEGKRPMRWNQIIDLSQRGHIIGAHTIDHYLTASSDENELKHQIIDCKTIIEDKLGKECEYFAWPYGRLEHTNDIAVEMACGCYKYVFSQSNYRHYFSFDGKVMNRRHFEPFWPISHIRYFLSKTIEY